MVLATLRVLAGSITLLSMLALPTSALAADPATADEPGEPTIEILVTARKKAENLQEVPLAITVFGAEELANRTIQSLGDVALQTPGLSFESFATGTYGTPVLRGLAQTDITSPLPNVSTFVDGIYLQRPYSVDLGVFDLERIEVVKGPQSALYGKNAFAGAINYVTRRPGDTFALNLSSTVGSDERRDLSARVDLPLTTSLSLAVTMAQSSFDGTWQNNHPASPAVNPELENVGGYENQAYGFAARLLPSDSLEINLAYYDIDKRLEPAANFFVSSADQTNTSQLECGPESAPRNFICSQISINPLQYAAPNSTRLPGIVLDPQAQFTNASTTIYRANVDYTISPALILHYLFGRVEAEAFSITGGDWDPLNPGLTALGTLNFGKGPAGRNEFSSHELRLDYELGTALSGTLGLYYAESRDRSVGENIFLPLGTRLRTVDVGDALTLSDLPRGAGGSTAQPISFPLEDGNGRDETRSIFGSTTWTVLDERLRLTAEARYTSELREADWQVFVLALGDFTPFSASETFYQFTPRLSVDYTLGEGHTLYASAARGIKSGGFNFAAGLPDEQTFGAEKNWTYEIGSKNEFFAGRLTANIAVYYIDWSDMAIRVQSTPPPFANIAGAISQIIGAATSTGIELDGRWLISDQLTLNYGLSVNRPEFANGVRSFRANNLCAPDTDDNGAPDGGAPCLLLTEADTGRSYAPIGGNTLPRTPTSNGNLGLQWDDNLGNLDYFLRSDVVHQSKQYGEEFNLSTIEARTLVNASAGLTDGNWRVQLWAKNLLGKEYVSSSFFIYIPNLGAATYIPSLGEKRTFGVTASVQF